MTVSIGQQVKAASIPVTIASDQGALAVSQSSAWSVGLSGTLPAFASTPTFNLGTLNGAALAANQAPVTSAGTTATTATAVQGATGMVPFAVTQAPSSSATLGITPVVSAATESSHVFKSSPGNLYSAYAVSTVAGYLLLINATTAPSNGAVTPLDCVPVQPGVATGVSFAPGPPEAFPAGIVAAFSSTGCTTLTLSSTAWLKGSVQ